MGSFQVSVDFVRLHINGLIVGENSLSSTLNNGSHSHGSRKVSLACTPGEADKNHEIQGYVHGVEVLPPTSSIKYYYLKVHASILQRVFISSKITCLLTSPSYLFIDFASDARIPHYNYLLIVQVPLTLKKTMTVCGALLVERLKRLRYIYFPLPLWSCIPITISISFYM